MDELLTIALNATADVLRKHYRGPMMNERYVHHFLSHRMQQLAGGPILDLLVDGDLSIHPEWPTFKQSTHLSYGRYRRVEGLYQPVADGTAGFIDFALGDYAAPRIAIEVSLKNGWSREEIAYDFVKLMDRRNPFTDVISCNILHRPNGVARGGDRLALLEAMRSAYREATARLGDQVCEPARTRRFVFTEIAPNTRRHWWFDAETQDFLDGEEIPPVLRQ
jgi:hypothetical protein